MAKYLTTEQYKRYSDGISLADVSDMTLAYMIARAEAAIDAHMGFDPKHGGFEPHFTMIQQAFNEHTRKSFFPVSLVPVRQITRYRIQISNLTTAGAGFFANINSSDCVINLDQRYVEIVPLQAVTYALTPVLVQLGLRPPIVEMDCEVGFYLPVWGEQLINSGDNTTYYALNGFWATTYTQALATQPNQLPPVPPVIYRNGIVQAGNYTLNTIDGSIVFAAANQPVDSITADYTYTIPDFVQEATVLQVSYLLSQRALHEMKMYKGLYQMRSGEQMISFPRSVNVGEQGRSTASSLSDDAAAVLAVYTDIAIA